MKAVYKVIAEINRIQAFNCPTLIIQRWIRGHLIRKSYGCVALFTLFVNYEVFIYKPQCLQLRFNSALSVFLLQGSRNVLKNQLFAPKI